MTFTLCLFRGCVYDHFFFQLLSYFRCLKVTTTRKLRPLRHADSESKRGRYFRNSTVFLLWNDLILYFSVFLYRRLKGHRCCSASQPRNIQTSSNTTKSRGDTKRNDLNGSVRIENISLETESVVKERFLFPSPPKRSRNLEVKNCRFVPVCD